MQPACSPLGVSGGLLGLTHSRRSGWKWCVLDRSSPVFLSAVLKAAVVLSGDHGAGLAVNGPESSFSGFKRSNQKGAAPRIRAPHRAPSPPPTEPLGGLGRMDIPAETPRVGSGRRYS